MQQLLTLLLSLGLSLLGHCNKRVFDLLTCCLAPVSTCCTHIVNHVSSQVTGWRASQAHKYNPDLHFPGGYY